MQRLRDYARFLVWSSGLGYLALWATTVWTLDLTRRRRQKAAERANHAPVDRSLETAITAEPRA